MPRARGRPRGRGRRTEAERREAHRLVMAQRRAVKFNTTTYTIAPHVALENALGPPRALGGRWRVVRVGPGLGV